MAKKDIGTLLGHKELINHTADGIKFDPSASFSSNTTDVQAALEELKSDFCSITGGDISAAIAAHSSVSALENHASSTNNPHNVTLAQISAADVNHTHPAVDITDLTSVVSALIGVHSSVVNNTSHSNRIDNPHNVTLAQISAADVSHNHSASNLTGFNQAVSAIVTIHSSVVNNTSHANRTDNPHNVTLAQISAADVNHTHLSIDITDLTATVSALIGVHSSVVNNTSHANRTDNPHSVTLAQLSAADVDHTHPAADITDLTAVVSALIESHSGLSAAYAHAALVEQHINWTTATNNFHTTGEARVGDVLISKIVQSSVSYAAITTSSTQAMMVKAGGGRLLLDSDGGSIEVQDADFIVRVAGGAALLAAMNSLVKVGIGTESPDALFHIFIGPGNDANMRIEAQGVANLASVTTVGGESASLQRWDQGNYSNLLLGGSFLWIANLPTINIWMSMRENNGQLALNHGLTLASYQLDVNGDGRFNQGLIVNDAGGSTTAHDFRVETTTYTQALYVDAQNDALKVQAQAAFNPDKNNVDFTVGTTSTSQALVVHASENFIEANVPLRLQRSFWRPVTTVTADYTMIASEDWAVIGAHSGITITLPAASAAFEKSTTAEYLVKHGLSPGSQFTLKRAGSENIDGSAVNITMDRGEPVRLISDGTDWWRA